MLNYIILYIFVIVSCCAGLIVFLLMYSLFNKRLNRLLLLIVGLSLILCAIDSLENYYISLDYFTYFRVVECVFSYIVKASFAFIFIIILTRNKTVIIVSSILLSLISVFSLTALFSDVCFSISESNEFVRGPLDYFVLFSTFALLGIIVVLSLRETFSVNDRAVLFFTVFCFLCLAASLIEIYVCAYGFVNFSLIITVTFYYIYLQSKQFRRDELTGAFNRQSLSRAIEEYKKKGFTIFSLDLNDLKKLNDNNGHAEGDKALKKLVSSCNDVIRKFKYPIYRTGGDEFVIISTSLDYDFNERLINRIKDNVTKAGYSVAVGSAIFFPNSNFDEVIKEADKNMYQDKYVTKNNLKNN